MRTLNVGFRTESFSPFAYVFEKTAREKYGFQLKPVPKFGSGEEAELSILGGEMDFILGNHYTPLAAKARGTHICWLAIPNLRHNYTLVTRPEFEDVEELAGKTALLPGGRCPAINMLLVLRQMGLEDRVSYADPLGRDRTIDQDGYRFLRAVQAGQADFALIDAPLDVVARRMGLRLFDTPQLDVISGPCITTTPSFAHRDPQLTKDLLRAYLEAIHAFKTDKDTVIELLGGAGFKFDINDPELVDAWYVHAAGRILPRPLPTPAALEWTQRKAAVDFPEAADVNPLRLLELNYLHELDQEGFIDELWAHSGGSATGGAG